VFVLLVKLPPSPPWNKNWKISKTIGIPIPHPPVKILSAKDKGRGDFVLEGIGGTKARPEFFSHLNFVD
jgi:hypothetical protein